MTHMYLFMLTVKYNEYVWRFSDVTFWAYSYICISNIKYLKVPPLLVYNSIVDVLLIF